MNIYNPRYVDQAETVVELEFDHKVYGRIPTSLKPDGSDADTEERKQLCEALKAVDIQPYIAPVISDDEQKANAMAVRDSLLLQTDWYLIRQVETGTAVPANVLNYRQSLRDITKQPGYPQLIEWPVLDA